MQKTFLLLSASFLLAVSAFAEVRWQVMPNPNDPEDLDHCTMLLDDDAKGTHFLDGHQYWLAYANARKHYYETNPGALVTCVDPSKHVLITGRPSRVLSDAELLGWASKCPTLSSQWWWLDAVSICYRRMERESNTFFYNGKLP